MDRVGALNVLGDQYVTYLNSKGIRIAPNVLDPPVRCLLREDKLRELHAAFSDIGGIKRSRVLAYGDPGHGKSVLALLYANRYQDEYALGRIMLSCSGKDPVALFADLMPLDERGQLSLEERAQVVARVLCSRPGYLVIFDNIDDEAHWALFEQPEYRLGSPCRVIVTSRNTLSNIPSVKVGVLTIEEAVDLLATYRPSAEQPEHRGGVEALYRESEGMAVLIAAAGAAMELDDDDDWAGYARDIAEMPTEEMPKDPSYPYRAGAILDAVADYDVAIGHREALRTELGPAWPAPFRGDLAKAYRNRTKTHRKAGNPALAAADERRAAELSRQDP